MSEQAGKAVVAVQFNRVAIVEGMFKVRSGRAFPNQALPRGTVTIAEGVLTLTDHLRQTIDTAPVGDVETRAMRGSLGGAARVVMHGRKFLLTFKGAAVDLTEGQPLTEGGVRWTSFGELKESRHATGLFLATLEAARAAAPPLVYDGRPGDPPRPA